ncbi:MAG: NlpC/P60 family protein [Bacillota bacterium]
MKNLLKKLRKKPSLLHITILFLLLFASPKIAAATELSPQEMRVEANVEAKTNAMEEQDLFVPIRSALEELGVEEIVWISEEEKIIFPWDGKEIVLKIGDTKVFVNGKPELLSAAPVNINGKALVPVDFFEKSMEIGSKNEVYQRIGSLVSRGGKERITVEENKRQQIVDTAMQYIGVPYKWGGTSPSGFDSSGFVWYVFKQNGIQLPRVSFDIFKAGKSISKEELLPGDLVFFEGYRPGPSHGTIYIGEGKFIHSPSTGKTVLISELDDTYYWKSRFYSGLRVIDLQ